MLYVHDLIIDLNHIDDGLKIGQEKRKDTLVMIARVTFYYSEE